MASSSDNVTTALDSMREVLGFVFSWIVLLGISVIVSGKLVGQHFVLGFSEDDIFSINLVAFKIRAKGDEVSLGFVFFVLCVGIVIIFGGADAYSYFKSHAGIDIGQWNSVCVIASFLSIFVAAVLWLSWSIFGFQPIVSNRERADQINRLTQVVRQSKKEPKDQAVEDAKNGS